MRVQFTSVRRSGRAGETPRSSRTGDDAGAVGTCPIYGPGALGTAFLQVVSLIQNDHIVTAALQLIGRSRSHFITQDKNICFRKDFRTRHNRATRTIHWTESLKFPLPVHTRIPWRNYQNLASKNQITGTHRLCAFPNSHEIRTESLSLGREPGGASGLIRIEFEKRRVVGHFSAAGISLKIAPTLSPNNLILASCHAFAPSFPLPMIRPSGCLRTSQASSIPLSIQA